MGAQRVGVRYVVSNVTGLTKKILQMGVSFLINSMICYFGDKAARQLARHLICNQS